MPRRGSQSSAIKKLKEENRRLREQLLLCKQWIQREIATQAYTINKRRAQENTKSLMSIESYEDIAHMIEGYFGQLIHVGNLSKAIPNLIDAEMNFFHFMKKKSADGFIVTNGYQKALETVIEATITSGYRTYARRIKTNLKVNNIHEKTLHKVVTKEYMLSAGKLFDIIKKLRKGKLEGKYEQAFASYLDKLGRLGSHVLSDEFFEQWSRVLETHAFGVRRHSGNIEKDEVRMIRKEFTGNYEDTESMLYQFLLAAQEK